MPGSERESSLPGSLLVDIRKRLEPGSGSGFTLDARFSVPPGITILFGASGSGKTTILDCIAGLTSPDAGRITIGDRVLFDAESGTNLRVPDRKVGFVFQDLGLFPHMSVVGNIQYGLAHLPPAQRQQRCGALLEAFHIADLGSRFPAQLSGGERQRVALARALVIEPGLLLLDEPLSALDVSIKTRIIEDLYQWNGSRRIPVLYVTHDRAEVFALGDRIIILEQGKVLAEGVPYEILHSPNQETVAHLAGFENVFDAEVIARNESCGAMVCRLGASDVCIETPLAQFTVGSRLRVGLRAGDILLAGEQPRSLSARNVLSGTVVSLRRQDWTLRATVDCGVLMNVHVTLAASQALGLSVGNTVWLVFKTHSCALLSG